jgi:two-component system response regulator MprA
VEKNMNFGLQFARIGNSRTRAHRGKSYILVVEDDQSLGSAIHLTLELADYEVSLATSGAAAINQFKARPPDLATVDLGLPDITGQDLVKWLRARSTHMPILVLTARDATSDRVAVLDEGADDYLVKPFALDEFQARIRALLRRANPRSAAVLEYEDLKMDTEARQVWRNGKRVDLTRTEFELLMRLLLEPNKVLRRAFIFQAVWGHGFGAESNLLDVHIGVLRRKLESTGGRRLIGTVRGVGFVLR